MNERMPIGCEEALRMLAEHLDDELETTRRRDVDEHLARCRSCFSRAEFERRLKTRLHGLREEPIEAAFDERIRALIGRFVSAPEGPARE